MTNSIDETIRATAKAAAERAVETLLKTFSPIPSCMPTKPAAHYIGMSHQFLEIGRTQGKDVPAHIKIGGAIRYLRTDLDAWLAIHRVQAR